MSEPRLRTVNKAVAPFGLNQFPAKFVEAFAKEVVFLDNCCWGTKTVFAGAKNISRQEAVRLVSGSR